MKNTRNTLAKTTILELIKNAEMALSHAEIQLKTGNLCDRVTIYRILERLVAQDEVHKIATPDGTIKYAACKHSETTKHQHNHVHFSCNTCFSVTCLPVIVPTFSLPKNYLATETHFTLSGKCPNCV